MTLQRNIAQSSVLVRAENLKGALTLFSFGVQTAKCHIYSFRPALKLQSQVMRAVAHKLICEKNLESFRFILDLRTSASIETLAAEDPLLLVEDCHV